MFQQFNDTNVWAIVIALPVELSMFCHGCLQVASHNTPTDCWLSFNGGVYDVTQLLQVGKHDSTCMCLLAQLRQGSLMQTSAFMCVVTCAHA